MVLKLQYESFMPETATITMVLKLQYEEEG